MGSRVLSVRLPEALISAVDVAAESCGLSRQSFVEGVLAAGVLSAPEAPGLPAGDRVRPAGERYTYRDRGTGEVLSREEAFGLMSARQFMSEQGKKRESGGDGDAG